MTHFLFSRSILALPLLLLSLAVPAHAQEDCALPPSLTNLLPTLSAFTAGRDGDTHQLARNLLQFDEKQVFAVLYPAGLIDHWGDIEQLLWDAEAIVRSGHAPDPGALARNIQNMHDLQAKLCKPMDAPDQGDARSTQAGGFGNRLQEAWTGLRLFNASPAQKVGMTFTLVAVLILLVYGLNAAKHWTLAVIYNRKACQIPATLEIGLDVIDGYLVVLGLSGCVFRAVNEGAHARVVVLSETDKATIYCGPAKLNVSLLKLGLDRALYLFDQQIPPNLHRDMLTSSLVAPSFAHDAAIPRRREAWWG